MIHHMLRAVEVRFPRLSTWFGGRLEFEVPAFLVSLTMHGLLLVCLAFVGYRVHQDSVRGFDGEVVDNLMSSSDSTFQDLDQSSNPPAPIAAAGSLAPTLAPTITATPSSAGAVSTAPAPDTPAARRRPPLLSSTSERRQN